MNAQISYRSTSETAVIGQSGTRPEPDVLVSDEVHIIMQWLLYGVLITIISSFGIVSNTINIICFVRQGLRDPVNVSLLGLATSDLGGLVTCFCAAICYNPALQMMGLPVDMFEFLFMAFTLPYVAFTGVTSWITALITLERCLCITMPLKVKSFITPKRVTVVILCIFIIFGWSVTPMYYAGRLMWVFSQERNRTILSVVFTEDRLIVEQIFYSVNNVSLPFCAYVMTIVCTVILVTKLRDKAKWRLECVTSVSADMKSKRDQKVSRMVIVISTLFIVCFSPICANFILLVSMPELAIDGPNQNLLYIFGGVVGVLQSANSSANIFIYYHMSSRYRAVIRHLFGCGKDGSGQRYAPDN